MGKSNIKEVLAKNPKLYYIVISVTNTVLYLAQNFPYHREIRIAKYHIIPK